MKPSFRKLLFLIPLAALVLTGCSASNSAPAPTNSEPEPAAGEPTFSVDILPIFEENCTRCHGDSRQNGGLRLDSYAMLMAGGTDGAVVVAGEADGSLLVELVTSGEMPKNAAELSAEEIATIREWIEAGARDN